MRLRTPPLFPPSEEDVLGVGDFETGGKRLIAREREKVMFELEQFGCRVAGEIEHLSFARGVLVN